MITVGGGGVSTPALTRAIREFGEQAKKQLAETGSLAGFEGKFTDDSSGGGSVTITVSALGAAAYAASAAKDDTFLAFTLTTAQPDGSGGTATSLSSGASEIIQDNQDIDTFIARFQGSAKQIQFGSFLYGTAEELAAVGHGPLPQPGDAETGSTLAANAGDRVASDSSSRLFTRLEAQQSASQRLIDLLQGFLDGFSESKRKNAADAEPGADSNGNAVRSRLAQFAATDVTT